MLRIASHTPTAGIGNGPPGIDGLLAVVPSRARLPAVVRNVKQIAQVVLDPATRIQKLTEALTPDIALSTEALRLANAAVAGTSTGRRVETVHQAILLLGFERMRDLAIGSAVFGMMDANNRAAAQDAGASIITAHHAFAIAGLTRHPRPETAYLAGLLRNLGELATAQWLPDAHRGWREAIDAGTAPSVASATHLGATPEQLGRALADHWRLPEPIRDALAAAPVPGASGPDAALFVIARLAHRMTDAIYRLPPPAEQAWSGVREASDLLGISHRRLLGIARWSFDQSIGVMGALRPGVNLASWTTRIDRVAPQHGDEALEASELLDSIHPRSEEEGAELETRFAHVLQSGALLSTNFGDGITPATSAQEATDDSVAQALSVLLDAGYQRAALLLHDPSVQELRVRYADGEGAEFLPQRLSVPVRGTQPLTVAYLNGRDQVLLDRLKIAALDDATLKRLRAVTIVWLPVMVSGIPIGALYADALRTGLVPPNAEDAAIRARDELNASLNAIRNRARAVA